LSLRIAFDLDGVLADMEAELVRQSGILFGEAMTRRIEERAAETSDGAAAAAPEAPAEASPDRQGSAEAAPDNVAPMMKLNMNVAPATAAVRHIGSIENFWETLAELEPGVIQRLAASRRNGAGRSSSSP